MISHLFDYIEKKYMVGYGGLLTWIFKKVGVPLEGLQFPMSSNKKIGAKCLTNLHLKLSDKGIMEEASIEDEEEEDSNEEKDEEKEKEKEKKDQKAAEEEQETVPTTTHDEAEVGSQGAQEVVQERGEQGEALSEGEASKEEKGEEPDDDDSSSDEEVRMLVKKKPIVTPRKSSRLASKRKRPIVSLDDDSFSHTTLEPQPTAPLSSKSATPPTTTYHLLHLHLFLPHLHQQLLHLLHHFYLLHQVLVLLVSLMLPQFLQLF